MSVDLRYWTRAELEALVRDIEATVVATALEPTAPTGVRTTAAASS